MYICYFDESGDDGFPARSSDIFVLTSLSLHHSLWTDINDKIFHFREWLKKEYNFPVNLEFHTREFLLNKNPYRQLNFEPKLRKEILFNFFGFLGELDVRIVNSAVNKSLIKSSEHKVLKTALKYSIKCIDEFLNENGEKNKFLIITDEGRVGKMINVTRQIQKNFVSPKNRSESVGESIAGIQRLVEEPLQKSSKESYFIQISDMVAYIVYLYICNKIHQPRKPWSPRLLQVLNYGDEIKLLAMIKGLADLKAHESNEFGIGIYPL